MIAARSCRYNVLDGESRQINRYQQCCDVSDAALVGLGINRSSADDWFDEEIGREWVVTTRIRSQTLAALLPVSRLFETEASVMIAPCRVLLRQPVSSRQGFSCFRFSR